MIVDSINVVKSGDWVKYEGTHVSYIGQVERISNYHEIFTFSKILIYEKRKHPRVEFNFIVNTTFHCAPVEVSSSSEYSKRWLEFVEKEYVDHL